MTRANSYGTPEFKSQLASHNGIKRWEWENRNTWNLLSLFNQRYCKERDVFDFIPNKHEKLYSRIFRNIYFAKYLLDSKLQKTMISPKICNSCWTRIQRIKPVRAMILISVHNHIVIIENCDIHFIQFYVTIFDRACLLWTSS